MRPEKNERMVGLGKQCRPSSGAVGSGSTLFAIPPVSFASLIALTTIMILRFWTDRSGQTVQTKFRLLLNTREAVWSGSTPIAIASACFGCIVLILGWLQQFFWGGQIFRIFMVFVVGYQTAYSQLAFAGKKEGDFLTETVPQLKMGLAKNLEKMSTANPGKVTGHL